MFGGVCSNLKARLYFFTKQVRVRSGLGFSQESRKQSLDPYNQKKHIPELIAFFLDLNLNWKEKQFLNYFFIIEMNDSTNLCT